MNRQTFSEIKRLSLISAVVLGAGFLLLLSLSANAQRRGDMLSFQGQSNVNDLGVKALAMGSAYTAASGDINALFHNSAGLAGLEKFQLSIAANAYSRSWQENQVYRPNRKFVTIPFYLEGLYIPDPDSNGVWDYELANDSAYIVNPPALGLDPYSDEAADWQRNTDGTVFNSIAAAFPFQLFGRQVVAAAAYSANYSLDDYDRNETFLDPHLGYNRYGNPFEVNGQDTLQVNWYDYQRSREGDGKDIKLAVGVGVTQQLQLGFKLNVSDSETDDLLILDKVGYFNLVSENRFSFSYDTSLTMVSGTSKFREMNAEIGANLVLNRFRLGLNLHLPTTLKREWAYQTTVEDSSGRTVSNESGEDRLKLPATLDVGLRFSPTERFVFAMDYIYAPYSKADYEMARPVADSLFGKWVDVRSIRFGVEFKASSMVSLLAGYRSLPVTFVPDGAAFDDRGPSANSYTAGFSITLGQLGRIDAAYEMRHLRYYDSYYSNTNYALETYNSFHFGYVYSF